MANTVKVKRSGTAAATPSSLEHGELAINYADDTLFWKDASNVIQSFVFQAYASATHASSHATGGSDALTPSDIGAAPAASPAFTGNATFTASSGVPLTVTNTGSNASFVVNDASGDTTPFIVDSSGNTGIGFGTPSTFNLVQNTPSLVVGDGTNAAGVTLYGASGSIAFASGTTGTDQYRGLVNYSHTLDALRLWAGATERVRITAAGLCGINTTSPASALDVNGVITVSAGSAASPAVVFANDADCGTFSPAANTWAVSTAGTERLRVTSGGSVGVGLTSPATAGTGKFSLDVNGPVIARGGIGSGAQTSCGVIDTAGDVTRLRAYGATSGSGAIDFRIGGGGGSSDAHGARLDSSANLILGSAVSPTGSRVLVLVNGTPPSASIGDCVMLYSEDVSASAELKVRDQAGNVTTLSPHNFTLIPEGPSEPMAWAYYSERDGHKINVDMLRLARLVERLTGEKLVYEE